jgi:hypothetical protein
MTIAAGRTHYPLFAVGACRMPGQLINDMAPERVSRRDCLHNEATEFSKHIEKPIPFIQLN